MSKQHVLTGPVADLFLGVSRIDLVPCGSLRDCRRQELIPGIPGHPGHLGKRRTPLCAQPVCKTAAANTSQHKHTVCEVISRHAFRYEISLFFCATHILLTVQSKLIYMQMGLSLSVAQDKRHLITKEEISIARHLSTSFSRKDRCKEKLQVQGNQT